MKAEKRNHLWRVLVLWELLILLGLLVLFSWQAPAQENLEWVGKVGKEVSWSKYLDSKRQFSWNGQIGVNIEVLRYRKAHLYLGCNLETVMRKHFSCRPYDINYTIEPGVKFKGRLGDLSLIFHHECHHDVDRHDGMNEMFNVAGIRLESKEKNIWKGKRDVEWLWNFNEMVSFGKYVGTTDVNYDYDAVGEVELNIMRHKKKVPYLKIGTHLVTQKSKNPSGKSHFINYIVEPGVKLRGPNGVLSLFCQLWRKHNIDRCNGQTDNFALLGMRYEW